MTAGGQDNERSINTLSQSELPGVRGFIKFQGTFNYNKITTATTSDIANYFGGLGELSASYNGVTNTQWKGWCDQLFTSLTSTDDFPKMYLVLQYASSVNSNKIFPPLCGCRLSRSLE